MWWRGYASVTTTVAQGEAEQLAVHLASRLGSCGLVGIGNGRDDAACALEWLWRGCGGAVEGLWNVMRIVGGRVVLK